MAKTVMDLQMGGAAVSISTLSPPLILFIQDLINTMTFECFEHCVTDFRSRSARVKRSSYCAVLRALEKKEKECISKCAKKFGSVVQRVNKRYGICFASFYF